MRVLKYSLLFVSLFVTSLAVAQPAAVTFSVSPSDSTVTYRVVHPLHKVVGVSKKVEGKARLLPDGKAQVMVRVATDSFDSGNVNRDAHVKEVIEAAKFPQVELKALGEGLAPPASFPSTVDKTFKIEVSFHGVKKSFDAPVKLTFDSADRIRAQSTVTVTFTDFSIERPSLMFKKVEDSIVIEANVVFTKSAS